MTKKPPMVIVYDDGTPHETLPLGNSMRVQTHDRGEYVIGGILVFDHKRYLITKRYPAQVNPGVNNPVVLDLVRDPRTRKQRRRVAHSRADWKRR